MKIDYDLLRESQWPDNQGHWWSQLSVNQVATGQELQQQQQEEKRKKKSRGNRQLQRYRAKLRKRGFDDVAIAQLINDGTDLQEEQEQQQEEALVTDDPIEITRPLNDQVRRILESHTYCALI